MAYHVTERLGTAVGIVSAAGTAGISLAPLLGAGGGRARARDRLGGPGARRLGRPSPEAAVLPRWFGTARLGAARGVVHTVAVASSALGPLLLALGRAGADSYRPVLLGLTVLPVVLAVVVAVVREPRGP